MISVALLREDGSDTHQDLETGWSYLTCGPRIREPDTQNVLLFLLFLFLKSCLTLVAEEAFVLERAQGSEGGKGGDKTSCRHLAKSSVLCGP